jgi:hypothetical protein
MFIRRFRFAETWEYDPQLLFQIFAEVADQQAQANLLRAQAHQYWAIVDPVANSLHSVRQTAEILI